MWERMADGETPAGIGQQLLEAFITHNLIMNDNGNGDLAGIRNSTPMAHGNPEVEAPASRALPRYISESMLGRDVIRWKLLKRVKHTRWRQRRYQPTVRGIHDRSIARDD